MLYYSVTQDTHITLPAHKVNVAYSFRHSPLHCQTTAPAGPYSQITTIGCHIKSPGWIQTAKATTQHTHTHTHLKVAGDRTHTAGSS